MFAHEVMLLYFKCLHYSFGIATMLHHHNERGSGRRTCLIFQPALSSKMMNSSIVLSDALQLFNIYKGISQLSCIETFDLKDSHKYQMHKTTSWPLPNWSVTAPAGRVTLHP